MGKTECIYTPVKRFTDVYLYIPVVAWSPLWEKKASRINLDNKETANVRSGNVSKF